MSTPDHQPKPVTILMADDDEEDCELTRDALQDARLANEMRFVPTTGRSYSITCGARAPTRAPRSTLRNPG